MRIAKYISKIIFLFLILFLPSFAISGFPAQRELSELQKQARIYYNQGRELQKQGWMDEASSCYQKAILLDAGFIAAYNDLAAIFQAKGDLERAELCRVKAEELSSFAVKPVKPGLAGKGGVKEAAKPAERPVELSKKSAEEISYDELRANNKKLQEQVTSLEASLKEAAKPAERPVELSKKSAEDEKAGLYQELGTAYTQAKLFDSAIEAYAKSLNFHPHNAEVHYNLGLLYKHSRNNSKKAVYHLKKYLQLSPEAQNRKEVEYLIKMLSENK